MFHFFTKQPPKLPDINSLPTTAVVLVFEPNIFGYRQVIQYCVHNPHVDLYRALIPLNNKYIDIGDSVTAGDFNFEYIKIPTWQSVEIVKIDQNSETRNKSDWPFATKHALLDFQMALEELENDIILPDAETGLSRVQEFYLKHQTMNEDLKISFAASFFDISKLIARQQYEKLSRGNLPTSIFPDIEQAIPRLLANGDYPFTVQTIIQKLESYLSSGKLPSWPEPIVFSECQKDEFGDIIAPPYGISKSTFHFANALDNISTAVSNFKYKATATQYRHVQLIWNGKCRKHMNFPTANDYMNWWIPITHQRMVTLLNTNIEHNEYDLHKRNFLFTIFVNKTFAGSNSKQMRYFVDESLSRKKQRIMQEFGGHLELLQIPIADVDEDALLETPKPVFDSARELWHHLLQEIKSQT